MNNLTKCMGIGLISLPLIFGCARQREKQETLKSYVKVQGTVFSESYMPASGSSFNAPDIQSRYSFSIDTKLGRKAIQVESTPEIRKESTDALIEKGTKVEIEIKEDYVNQQVYTLRADKVMIIDSLSPFWK